MTSPCLLCLSLERMDKKDIWHTQSDVYVSAALKILAVSLSAAKLHSPGCMAEVAPAQLE